MPGLPGASGPAMLPEVYVARSEGGVILPDSEVHELARLSVGPGSYLVTAKVLVYYGDQEVAIGGKLRLSTGETSWFSHGNASRLEIPDYVMWPVVLHDVATFAEPTVIALTALADTNGFFAGPLVLTALRVGAVNPVTNLRGLPVIDREVDAETHSPVTSHTEGAELQRLTALLNESRQEAEELRSKVKKLTQDN